MTGVAVMRESGGVDIFEISELSKGNFDISQEKREWTTMDHLGGIPP